jgi:hypothetical protein
MYCFAPEYISKYIYFPLHNAKLQRRIELTYDEFGKEAARGIHGQLNQVSYIKELTIAKSYEAFIKANYSLETDQYNSIVGSATRIINGDFTYCRDNTSGRFHSNVTNMDKQLREFLRCKGEPLVNIDIKNSQPYLSTIILTDPGKVSNMTKNPAFAMLLQSLKYKDNEDVKKYIHLVVSGQLYEFLMNEFINDGLELTRTETKRQVLRILFARNRMPKDETNRKARQIFINKFPTVHRIFSKVRGHENGDKFQSFSRFAILLQSIESHLMLDLILKRIYKELPGTIAITIHDSIMTGVLTDNVKSIKKIMIEELTYFVGFQPQIKIDGRLEEKKEELEEVKKKQEETSLTNQYLATTPVSFN